MKYLDWILGISVLVILIGIIAWGTGRHDDWKLKCESLGGVYFNPQAGSVCLKKEAVIPVREIK